MQSFTTLSSPFSHVELYFDVTGTLAIGDNTSAAACAVGLFSLLRAGSAIVWLDAESLHGQVLCRLAHQRQLPAGVDRDTYLIAAFEVTADGNP